MLIPLEDGFADVIGKAQRGLRFSTSELAKRAGVAEQDARRVLDGDFDEKTVRRLASSLALDPEALCILARREWFPTQPPAFDGFATFNTPFDDITVNAYLLWDSANSVAIAVDTGADVSDMLEILASRGLTLSLILITHAHGDHIFDLDRLLEKTGAAAFACSRERLDEAEAFEPGRIFKAGELRVESRLTCGHSAGGITYVVSGLRKELAVVGDALFAGSMGGGVVSYQDALRTNREQIFTLPAETILCPGHGPLTTVGQELEHNPFFAAIAT